MIKEETLNNIIVKPLVTVDNSDENKVKGGKLFKNPYNCTFLCAKRKSGKTSVLAHILQKTSDKKTTFWIFCPTNKVDSSWIALIKLLEDRGSQVNVFDSISDGKVNLLDEIVTDLSNPEEYIIDKKEKNIENKPVVKVNFGDSKEKKKQEYKPKKLAPLHIFVFDDISNELKNPALVSLCKKSRHFKASVYISSQYIHDLQPQTLKQLDYFLCFKSFSRDKLEHIHKVLDLTIDIDKFYNVYDFCFENSMGYDFLYIDVREQEFRKNFNKKLNLDI
jgi:hypothetical protein